MEKITNFSDWETRFQQVYDRAMIRYRSAPCDANTLFPEDDATFLTSIGCTSHELYDFVEDWCDSGVPTFETVLHITTIRRDYFLNEQQNHPSATHAPLSSFPPMDAELGGYLWLPRIIAKAKAKLRGELPPEVMYNCGGDRHFLKTIGLEASAFLKVVRDAKDDNQILDYVQETGKWPGQ
ncbi:MAG: hypothetical protein CMH81_05990 [Nitrospiraceae bacterium]|nr:hypothetical protein [Nitrospiraceae bacterium]|tara:strand:- start:2215 stop:2757 length:543 start_codon:yes stop_codon:yes gene_type:complete